MHDNVHDDSRGNRHLQTLRGLRSRMESKRNREQNGDAEDDLRAVRTSYFVDPKARASRHNSHRRSKAPRFQLACALIVCSSWPSIKTQKYFAPLPL